MKKKRQGFTLVETVTTLFIVSLLAMLVIPNVEMVRKTAKERQNDAMVKMIAGQIALYFESGRRTSVSLNEMVTTGYLTEDQARAADAAHIVIKNSKVRKEP